MIKRGDVYYADLDPVIGSEQKGHRPIIVIQNDIGNLYSPTTIAAMVTSSQKKKLPTHVHVKDESSGLSDDSIVMLEQIRTIDKQRLCSMIGHVSDKTMALIEDAALLQSRDRKVTKEENAMYYKNKTHQRIFEEQVNGNPCKCPNEYLAALYLLTADRDLWRAAKYEIERKVIDFSKIRPKEYTTNNYTVFIVAKDIYHGETHITLKDICDRYLVPDQLFELFVTAIHICRLGYTYTGIEKVFN